MSAYDGYYIDVYPTSRTSTAGITIEREACACYLYSRRYDCHGGWMYICPECSGVHVFRKDDVPMTFFNAK